LQALGFELLTRTELSGDAAIRVTLVASMARAAGVGGMVLGQAQDIAAETAHLPLNLAQISRLQALKTGALIEWSCAVGPVLAGKDGGALAEYARALGLAFQITDDVLDETGDVGVVGKRLGKDANAGKATFVSLLGIEDARRMASAKVTEACAALTPFGDAAAALQEAARFVISRDR